MKTIYVFLTRSVTITSRFVYMITKDRYTHTSIAFDDQLSILYSSGRKNGVTPFPAGPCYEGLNKGIFKRSPCIRCAVYALQVSDEVYERAKGEAQRILDNADDYKFNVWGMAACYMKKPYRPKNRFFCSQFVGEILTRSGAVKLPKDPSLMRPIEYSRLPELTCVYEGRICDLLSSGLPVPSADN